MTLFIFCQRAMAAVLFAALLAFLAGCASSTATGEKMHTEMVER